MLHTDVAFNLGSCPPARAGLRLTIRGFLLPPNQPITVLRDDDEVTVSPSLAPAPSKPSARADALPKAKSKRRLAVRLYACKRSSTWTRPATMSPTQDT